MRVNEFNTDYSSSVLKSSELFSNTRHIQCEKFSAIRNNLNEFTVNASVQSNINNIFHREMF